MVKLPSEKQRRIVKSKIKGVKHREIANIEYPQASQESKDVIISRELKKPHVAKYMDKELSLLLQEQGVTKSQYITNVGQAMKADKQNTFTGEITPDWTTRLSANKMAERFLKFEEDNTPVKQPELDGLDDMQLVGAVFKTKSS